MKLKEKLIRFWPYIALVLIIALGFALHLYRLASHPPGLTWDEAALGYNVYSIIKTARDEHGTLLPLIFKSFGDYKPGLYIYLTTPFVFLFGLNSFAVRLPSAIFGTLAIYGVFLLVRLAFDGKKSTPLALFSSFALAVSPWHLHFSHAAWEANVFVTLLVFALYFFLKFIKHNIHLWPSVVLATLTFFVYQGAKMLTPLVFLTVMIIYWKVFITRLISVITSKKLDLSVVVICAAITASLFVANLIGPAGNRLQRLSILGYRPQVTQHVKQIDDYNPLSLALFHHQIDLSIKLIFSRYLHHFSPELLFYAGNLKVKREHLPGQGMLYILDFIWLSAGLYYLLNKKRSKAKYLVLSLLMISPLPASLTLSEASTVRAIFMVIPLSILIGAGLYQLFQKKWLFIPLAAAYLLTIALSLDIYFNHSDKELAQEFNYGHKKAVEVIERYPDSKVLFTDVYGQPYIYYLFYTQYPPSEYQSQVNFIQGGVDVGRVARLDKVSFQQFSVREIERFEDTVFVGSTGNIPDSFNKDQDFIEFYKEITLPDSTDVVFRVIKTK